MRTADKKYIGGDIEAATYCIHRIADIWESHLRPWVVSYLNANGQDIYMKYYVDQGYKLLSEYFADRKDKIEETTEFIKLCPELEEWETAKKIVRDAKEQWKMQREMYLTDKYKAISDAQEELQKNSNIFINKEYRRTNQFSMSEDWVAPPPAYDWYGDYEELPTMKILKKSASIMVKLIEYIYPVNGILNECRGACYCDDDEQNSSGACACGSEYRIFLILWQKMGYIDKVIKNSKEASSNLL